MNTSIETKPKPSQGIGYLVGSAVSIIMAIIVFTISKNVTIAISTAIPTGTALGIAFEQKRQGKREISKKQSYYLRGLLILGIGMFIFVLLLSKSL